MLWKWFVRATSIIIYICTLWELINSDKWDVAVSIPSKVRIWFSCVVRSLAESAVSVTYCSKNCCLIDAMRFGFFFEDLGVYLLLLRGCLGYYFLLLDFTGVFLLLDLYLVGVFADIFRMYFTSTIIINFTFYWLSII